MHSSSPTRRVLSLLAILTTLLLLAACAGAPAEPAEEEAPAEEEPAEEEEAAEEEEMEEEEPLFTQEAVDLATATSAAAAELEVAFEGETALQADGAVTSGVLSVESLGVGTVDATAPSRMTTGEAGTVHLEIEPLFDPEDVQVEAYVTVTAIEDEVEVLNFYDELRLYSIMGARLSAPGFEVESPSPEVQRLLEDRAAVWVWNIVARDPGRRPITVSISVPIVVDGEVIDVATSPLRTIDFVVEVVEPPTPTPTLTPVPLPTPVPTPTPTFVARTFSEMGPEIVAALILSAIGAAGGFIWRRVRKQKR